MVFKVYNDVNGLYHFSHMGFHSQTIFFSEVTGVDSDPGSCRCRYSSFKNPEGFFAMPFAELSSFAV